MRLQGNPAIVFTSNCEPGITAKYAGSFAARAVCRKPLCDGLETIEESNDSDFHSQPQIHMKTNHKSILSPLRSFGAVSAIILAALAPATALADFNGSDSLSAQVNKWAPFTDFGKPGGGKYSFQNSRLEFLVKSPTHKDLSILRWTENQGGYAQDWFIQVDVHLDNVALSQGGYTNLNLGVINTEDSQQGYIVAIDRYQDRITYISGFETSMVNELEDDYQRSSAINATLRIHFDSVAKTLTSSWKTGSGWKYFPSVKITDWDMDKSSTFTAFLAASGGGGNDKGRVSAPVIKTGEAFFSNFKTGSAKPDISVEQPVGSDLTDGNSKKSFGSVPIGGDVTKTFTVRNNGSAILRNLKITQGGIDAADFTITGPTRMLVKPGATATFRVNFQPKATGTKNSIVNVISNDPDESRFEISLTGLGVK